MIVDALAPCVTKSSAAMTSIWDKQLLSSTSQDFKYVWHLRVKKYFFVSYNQFSTTRVKSHVIYSLLYNWKGVPQPPHCQWLIRTASTKLFVSVIVRKQIYDWSILACKPQIRIIQNLYIYIYLVRSHLLTNRWTDRQQKDRPTYNDSRANIIVICWLYPTLNTFYLIISYLITVQSSAAIHYGLITWHAIQALQLLKQNINLSLMDLLSVYCDDFRENWPHSNGTILCNV